MIALKNIQVQVVELPVREEEKFRNGTHREGSLNLEREPRVRPAFSFFLFLFAFIKRKKRKNNI